jgi:tRNA (Thr-GGU) A37 N-methylase
MVRGLDCLDGTPLLDLKPDRGLFTPRRRNPAISKSVILEILPSDCTDVRYWCDGSGQD